MADLQVLVLVLLGILGVLSCLPLSNWLWIRHWQKEGSLWSIWVEQLDSTDLYAIRRDSNGESRLYCTFCNSERLIPKIEKIVPNKPKFGIIQNRIVGNSLFKSTRCGRCTTELFREHFKEELISDSNQQIFQDKTNAKSVFNLMGIVTNNMVKNIKTAASTVKTVASKTTKNVATTTASVRAVAEKKDKNVAAAIPEKPKNIVAKKVVSKNSSVVAQSTMKDDPSKAYLDFLPTLKELPMDRSINFSSSAFLGVSNPARFQTLMDEAMTLVPSGLYLGDSFFAWMRNNSLFEDEAFRSAWQQNITLEADRSAGWRRYILATTAYNCVQLEGEFVECGVYLGTGLKTVVDYLGGEKFPKLFFGFDTFDFGRNSNLETVVNPEEMLQQIQGRFANYPQVKLILGADSHSLEEFAPKKIAFLHLDLNQAQAEIDALNILFERVVPGGVVVLDDYEWSGIHREQKNLEDPWFDQKKYRVIPLPTGQGMIIKR